MACLPILTFPDPRLKTVAQKVLNFDANLKKTVTDLFETMYHENGAGLAATQVNIHQRLFVMDISPEADQPLCMINPEIIDKSNTMICNEGCLSFPGLYAKVSRHAIIKTRYYDPDGIQHERTSDGLEANCIQHELDHLNGIIFIDHLSKLKKNFLIRKMNRLSGTPQ